MLFQGGAPIMKEVRETQPQHTRTAMRQARISLCEDHRDADV